MCVVPTASTSEQSPPSISQAYHHLSPCPQLSHLSQWGAPPPPRLREPDGRNQGLILPKGGRAGAVAPPLSPPQPPGSQGRLPPSSLAPPSCHDPCPWAPGPVAFCCHSINHRPGQGWVRNRAGEGIAPGGPQTEWLPMTPDSPGQGPSGASREVRRIR